MKSLSKLQKAKLNQGRDKWNRRLERPNNGSTKLERHGRSQLQQIGLNPYDNELESNQHNSGHKEGQTTKTGEQLMQMTLELRK